MNLPLRRLALLGLVLLAPCSQNPAGPPAPPAEVPIPSVIDFPETLLIDINEIEAQTSLSAPLAAVAPGGEFSDIIVAGADLANSINDFNDVVLSIFEGLEVPVSHEQATFETADVKIDFGDFDVDGDGADEGCTGCTCPVGCAETCPTSAALADFEPVCYRAWFVNDETGEFERRLAGRLDFLPDDGNPGEGIYRAVVLSETTDGIPDLRLVGAIYDHVDSDDAAKKSTDISLLRYLLEDDASIIQEERIHGITSQETLASSGEVRKTVGVDYLQIDDDGFLTDFLDYAARFLEEGLFWRGSVASPTYSFTNQCVDLRTGNAATDPESDDCEKLDVSGVTVDAASSSDVAFPAETEFPSTPTF